MKDLDELVYDLKNLKVVMINKNFLEQKNNDYINYFNENVKFIVEKYVIEDKDKYGLPYYAEYYTECITEEDLSVRQSHKPFMNDPDMFSLIEEIPEIYLTEEEIKTGKITVRRIFKILQDINILSKKEPVIEEDNNKKLTKRRKRLKK